MEERGMEDGSNMMSACSRPLLDRRLKPQAEQDLKCPRCDSTNTKFCYYNNYSLTQPRHFCKTCRRYWTKGGSLRSVPVGGGCRKNSKRSNNSSNTSTTKRSGDQPCSTSTTSNEGTVTSVTGNDLSSPNPSLGGSSNSYAYYNETEDLGINYGRPLGDSGYVNDFGQSSLTGFQSCLPSNLTNLQSLHYSGFLGGDHVFARPAANHRLGTMNVGDLSSIIESKPITSTSFDRDAYVHHNNHNNSSVDQTLSLSHSRLLMQQHHQHHQKSMYEAEPPQGLYEGGYINGGGIWTDLSPYGLPNVNHSM